MTDPAAVERAEIERVTRVLAEHFAGHRHWTEIADDRAELRRLSRSLIPGITHPYDINEPTKDDLRGAARAAIAEMRKG